MSQGLCTSCGAVVNLAAGQDEINCTYCGTLVKRPEAEAQFNEVKNSKFGGTLLLAQMALEIGNADEARTYYNKAIEQNEKEPEAWFGRAASYTYFYEGASEFIQSSKTAIALAQKPEAMGRRLAQMLAKRIAMWLVVTDGLKNIVTPPWAYDTLVISGDVMISQALEWDSSNEFLALKGCAFYIGALKHIWDRKLELKNNQLLFLQGKDINGNESSTDYPAPNESRRQYRMRLYRDIYGIDEDMLSKQENQLRSNCEKYLQALLKINSEAAKPIENEWRNCILRVSENEQKMTAEIAQLETKPVGEFDGIVQHFKDGKCFVATACYGDYDHPTVIELRRFRDDYLETSSAGRAFVRWYYQWSPAFANLVAKSKILKTVARVLIVNPAVAIARFFTKNPQ
jgi:hypothetical protein